MPLYVSSNKTDKYPLIQQDNFTFSTTSQELQTVKDITGKGYIASMIFTKTTSSSHSIQVRITLDGYVCVYGLLAENSTTSTAFLSFIGANSYYDLNTGLDEIGGVLNSNNYDMYYDTSYLKFNKSCKIEIKSHGISDTVTIEGTLALVK